MAASSALRSRRYRARHRAQGLCYNCPRPIVKGGLCARHIAKHKRYRPIFLKNQRKNRVYRTLLGFCTHCKNLPAPGVKVCAKHLRAHKAAVQKYRDKKAQRRGWKLMRVKV